MKNALFASALTLISSAALASKTIPAGIYTIDTAHSKVGFEIPHLVIATVEGRFTGFEGTITIHDKLEKSKAKVQVNVASINTDNKDRDDHLRSADFFDVKKHPQMIFAIKKISGPSEALKVLGDLTLKGKTKEVTLDGKYLGEVKDAYGNLKIAFAAKGKINRKDFGLTWGQVVEAGPVVGDEVTLDLKIEANKPLDKKD